MCGYALRCSPAGDCSAIEERRGRGSNGEEKRTDSLQPSSSILLVVVVGVAFDEQSSLGAAVDCWLAATEKAEEDAERDFGHFHGKRVSKGLQRK